MSKKKKKIGILTAGGDCPGLNAAIRGVGKTAIVEYGMEVIGFRSGYSGLINNDYIELKESQLSGILTLGGTILGTSREKPFKLIGSIGEINDKPDTILQNYQNLGLDALVCIGGNGTMKTANMLSKHGLNVVGIPKTIDNDVWGTDVTFGFESAVEIATEAIDRLHTTANSHQRVMIIEVMGHNAGWLALYSGTAGGGDIILLPELPYNIRSVCKKIESRYEDNKPYSITEYGAFAAECIAEGNFGTMAAYINNKTVAVPLSEVGGKTRLVKPNDPLVMIARRMGISFGDEYLK